MNIDNANVATFPLLMSLSYVIWSCFMNIEHDLISWYAYNRYAQMQYGFTAFRVFHQGQLLTKLHMGNLQHIW